MYRVFRTYSMDVTSIFVVGIVVFFICINEWIGEKWLIQLPNSFQQLNTIFLSILIEAIPFVLIGVLIAGFIQIFVTEEHIQHLIPKNKVLAVAASCIVGGFFPACECGIVPIVRRLVAKGVPIYAGVGFLLTGPLINPIVIMSTYMAFGNDIKMASLRMGVGFVAALLIAFIISLIYKSNQLKYSAADSASSVKQLEQKTFFHRLEEMVKHSIDEFFDMGKYLFIGAFIAAFLQTYVATSSLFLFGDGLIESTIVMMGLAYILSLCSEADAFIGASFRNLFPSTSILAFLIYGPMIDLKNTIMLLSVFKARFVVTLLFFITIIVFICINLITFI
ncbi:permease [Salibacterium salarium]|uniref:Permease n=1 Tax=Salibacterium salarium TaxID=284579 RepID=A0A428MVF4_9BACI|nr:permease [Salibacterium salarium]RSL30097.1 permease [Salibacterium salarium]